MEIRILGPIDVLCLSTAIHLARRQQRLIIGVLALEANRVVPVERLINILWDERPPAAAKAVIQSRISEVRRQLGRCQCAAEPVQLSTRTGGYMLEIDPESTDVHRFKQLVGRSSACRQDDEKRRHLRAALDLWRGQVLGGWCSQSPASPGHSLEAARLAALEDLYDVELRSGNHIAVVDDLVQVAAAHPDRERLVSQMIQALHGAGRTVEALHSYQRYRRWLAEELGVDPSPDLQRLHLAVLRADTDVGAGEPLGTWNLAAALAEDPAKDAGWVVSVPRSLPPDIPDFVGRGSEMRELSSILCSGSRIAAVSGPGGVGKTAFTIHAAHLVGQEFPDGQLYADLRGADENRPPRPVEVLERFLRVLGVEDHAIPNSLEECVDLYRSLLSLRKVCVVLDNAQNAEQVLPLLPGISPSGVVINSRDRLGSILGVPDIALDRLDPNHAIELLARLIGAEWVDRDHQAAIEIADLCDRLPLALRIAGAKLAAKPHWSPRDLIRRLGDERRRLDHLAHGHLDVRSSIMLSYAGLGEEARRLLRRLGDLGLPEVNVWTSAALLDTVTGEAEELLERLFDAQLLDVAGQESTGHTRYRLHDLIRLFAYERAQLDEPRAELDAARARAFDAWLSAA